MSPSLRQQRIAEQLRAEIARVLSQEATDPRLRMVTLTRVDVAPDLSNALVFWSTIEWVEGVDSLAVAEGLDAAASFLRRRVARSLPLRRMPELRFRHDPSLELGGRTLSLLRSLPEGQGSGGQEDGA